MASHSIEKRLLQSAIAISGCVPVIGGASGMVNGETMFGNMISGADIHNHIRYLSGLLFAIGLCFWAMIPRVEFMGPYIRMLTIIVLIGGLARLYGVIVGEISPVILFALMMELMVTPLICLWQWRISKKLYHHFNLE